MRLHGLLLELRRGETRLGVPGVHALCPAAHHRVQLVAKEDSPLLAGGVHNIPVGLDGLEAVGIEPLDELSLVNLPVVVGVQRLEEVKDLPKGQVDVEGSHTEPEVFLSHLALVEDVEETEDIERLLEGEAKLSRNLISQVSGITFHYRGTIITLLVLFKFLAELLSCKRINQLVKGSGAKVAA
jgi:hypothetical protein